jgi:hypothetical protein
VREVKGRTGRGRREENVQITYCHTAYASMKGAFVSVGLEEGKGEDDERRPHQREEHGGGHVEGDDRNFGSGYHCGGWEIDYKYIQYDTIGKQ